MRIVMVRSVWVPALAVLLSACPAAPAPRAVQQIPDPEPTVAVGIYLDLPAGWRWGNAIDKRESGADRIRLSGEPAPSIDPTLSLYEEPRTVIAFNLHSEADGPRFGTLDADGPRGNEPLWVVSSTEARPMTVGPYRAVTGTYQNGPAYDPMRKVGVYWYLPDVRVAIDFWCERPFPATRLPMDQTLCARGLTELRAALEDIYVFPPGSLYGGRPTPS